MTTDALISGGTASALPAPGQIAPKPSGCVLIVDDDAVNRKVLRKTLESQGYEIVEVESGEQALQHILHHRTDTILLDVMMPKMDGFDLCRLLKKHERTAAIPVLMVTALSARDERLRGIECGATDFLSKPVDIRELTLRVRNAVYTKHLIDQLLAEQQRSDRLLMNMLPVPIANRIKAGEQTIADHHGEVTLVIADLIGLTELGSVIGPEQVIYLLNEIFSSFDAALAKSGLEKIKMVGGSYMAASGVPRGRVNDPSSVAEFALQMRDEVSQFNHQYNTSVNLRVALHTGPVVAGVLGRMKFSYDLWGATVNEAWALISADGHRPGLFASSATGERLKNNFQLKTVQVMNSPFTEIHELLGRKPLPQNSV